MAISNTTGLTIIADAMQLGGVGDQYNVLDANTANLGLRILNRMLDNWSAEVTPLYNIVDSQTGAPTPGFTLVAGQSKYILGASNLLGVRPTEIADIYLADSNSVSYYQQFISADEYSRLIYKVAPGRPDRVYINYNETTVELNFYPQPAYLDQVHVLYLAPLINLATTATTVTLPPGYEEAIVYNLAVRIAPWFGGEASPSVIKQASWAKTMVSQANENRYFLQSPIPTQKRRFFNVLTGGTV